MNTTNKQDEILEDAAKKHSPARVGINSFPEKKAFIAGANWQKEQDKVVIDKLTEALKGLYDFNLGKPGYLDILLNNAESTLNSLK